MSSPDFSILPLAYTFTTQKNVVRNEVIGLGHSGDPVCCPISATACHIQHLRDQHAPPTAPSCTSYYRDGSPSYTSPLAISPPLYKPQSRRLAPSWVSSQPTSVLAPYVPRGPWLFSALMLMPTSSVFLAGGGRTSCFDTSQSKPNLLCAIFLGRCSKVPTTFYFPTKTSKRRQTPFYFLYFPAFDPLWLSRPPTMFVRLLHILPK